MIDGINQLPAPLFFYQKDAIDISNINHAYDNIWDMKL